MSLVTVVSIKPLSPLLPSPPSRPTLSAHLVECLVPDGGAEAGAVQGKRSLHELSLTLVKYLRRIDRLKPPQRYT